MVDRMNQKYEEKYGTTQKNIPYICNCKDLNIRHSSSLVHEEGEEDAMPCYEKQKKGDIKITICSKCHGRLISHRGVFKRSAFEDYFKIENPDKLIENMAEGYVGTGSSKENIRRLFNRCVRCQYNPERGHAGKTLKLSLKNQGVIDELGWEKTSEKSVKNEDSDEGRKNEKEVIENKRGKVIRRTTIYPNKANHSVDETKNVNYQNKKIENTVERVRNLYGSEIESKYGSTVKLSIDSLERIYVLWGVDGMVSELGYIKAHTPSKSEELDRIIDTLNNLNQS